MMGFDMFSGMFSIVFILIIGMFMAEGDRGVLSFQGTRFISFNRK